MIDPKKAQIIAQTIGTLSNMSAHCIIAGYLRHFSKTDDERRAWAEKIADAERARQAAIDALGAMLVDSEKYENTKKNQGNPSAKDAEGQTPESPPGN